MSWHYILYVRKYLGYDILHLAPGFVSAVIITEPIQYLLVLKLMFV